ncbi:MAG: type II secretion system F family protein [Verrucomicrobia bacterium]|nr:type II secretion system F family protein [Verrucomicrobiota bacterium]
MPIFKYIARSREGEKVDGTVEANDRRQALLQIERMGHVPMSVTEGGAGSARARKDKRKKKKFAVDVRRGKKARIKMRDLLMLSRELSDLLSSGMTLGNALNTLSNRQTGKAQDEVIAELRDEIIQGSNLSDALAKRPDSFPTLYVSMVRAGEASGALAHSLENLCMHYERVQEAREKVVMALIYPCIVLIIGIGTIIFSMVFVVPRFTAIFAELGSTLPLPTQILIAGSNVLIHYGWAVAGVIALLVVVIRRALRTEQGRRWWHRRQLKLPVVKNIVNANAFAHFARTLGALLANGVPVLKALSIVEDTVGNVVIAEEIRDARDRVTDGATISEPLAAGKVFPNLLTDMLAVGEESGDMTGALSHIARRYDDELDRAVKVFTSVLEPILILVMAVLVGFLAISMLLAVFDLTSGLSV